MAVVAEPDAGASALDGAESSEPEAAASPTPGRSEAPRERMARLAQVTPRRLAAVGVAWVAVTVMGVALVIYGLGPMLEQRDQRHLLSDYRAQISQAANEAFGLPGVSEVTEAPTTGDPVAIVEIGAIRLRQVVIEGVGPQQTRHGPGHVPGTAAPGQPGNSVVVGRQSSFGGPMSQLDELEQGDEIGVITTQGESVYQVTEIDDRRVPRGDAEVYGPSEDDRLTLVTSGSILPWSTNPATVVVAMLRSVAFEPTPQGGRTDQQDGRGRDGSAVAPVLLGLLGYACAAGAAILLYRRTRPRSAYLMSAPLLVVATILVAEAAARLLPAWF